MPRLKVATYNTYRERKGRDPLLDDLLLEDDALICLQELSVSRALEIKRRFGRRAYLSPVMYGWEFLALILPENASFVRRRAEQLTFHAGLLPRGWSLRRVRTLYPGRRHGWNDGLLARAVQVAEVRWRGREFRAMNTHLPHEHGLRDGCLDLLHGVIGEGDVLLMGDLNATPEDLFLKDLLLATGLKPAGPPKPTHDSRRRIDYVLYRGGFGEAGYGMKRGKSDHRLVRAVLEVS